MPGDTARRSCHFQDSGTDQGDDSVVGALPRAGPASGAPGGIGRLSGGVGPMRGGFPWSGRPRGRPAAFPAPVGRGEGSRVAVVANGAACRQNDAVSGAERTGP
jgi:hypothetical protein